MSGLKGNLASLAKLAADLRRLPRAVVQKVPPAAAIALSATAKQTFDASSDPYGKPWAPGVDGRPVTLRKTGALERFIYYVARGTKLGVYLGVPYAKYQIGKRPVFPRKGKDLPASYTQALASAAIAVIRSELRGAA